MLTPVLSWVSNSKDASTITLKDTTGTYNVSTNPGGYGTPNPDQPTVIGIRLRYWADTNPYAHLVTDSAGILSGLLGSGYAFTTLSLGLVKGGFSTGVHHFKYYPLEEVSTGTAALTLNSKLVTVTGVDPTSWNTLYKGIMFWNGTTLGRKVYLIDRTQPITSTTFYLTEAWEEATVSGLEMMIGTEADLKVLVKEPANNCLVSRIGKLGEGCGCNTEEIDTLVRMTMWMFSAQVNFDCKDYSMAHNKLVAIDLECNKCKKTCSCT